MFQPTSSILKKHGVTRPTLIVFEDRARRNIRRMLAKSTSAGVTLRPHFKTHQSVEVAAWFAAEGVDRITVSSLTMAEKFSAASWLDITLAFLLNPLQLPKISRLAANLAARGGSLGITIDSPEAAAALATIAAPHPEVWLKIDTGYHRTGIPWNDTKLLNEVVRNLPQPPTGILTHAGHSYHTSGAKALKELWVETLQNMQAARTALRQSDLLISVGDTPTCSTVNDVSGVDEIRPGNFVYYDLMQLQIGSCLAEHLAAAVACPVVGLYPERGQVVIHGGAIHLSKEPLEENGALIFGKPGLLEPGRIVAEAAVTELSQEHGTITFKEGAFPAPGTLAIGDLLLIWPVHSCLAADLLECRPSPSSRILP